MGALETEIERQRQTERERERDRDRDKEREREREREITRKERHNCVSLTQVGPMGGIPPLDISGCLTTLVSLRHVIWISHSSASFGEAIRHKIYDIQCLFFRKLGFENA